MRYIRRDWVVQNPADRPEGQPTLPIPGWVNEAGVQKGEHGGWEPAYTERHEEIPAQLVRLRHSKFMEHGGEVEHHSPDVTNQTKPLTHVYRGMSQQEWDNAQKNGHFKSNGKWQTNKSEGTLASAYRDVAQRYALGAGPIANEAEAADLDRNPRNKGIVVKFAVHPDEKWFATRSADHEVGTRAEIPFSRVVSAAQFKDGVRWRDIAGKSQSSVNMMSKHLYGDRSLRDENDDLHDQPVTQAPIHLEMPKMRFNPADHGQDTLPGF